MKSRLHLSVFLIGCMCLTGLTSAGQQSRIAPGGATASAAVPNLIKYSSVLKDGSGSVITALSGVTFLIYKDEQGGAPLWMETQNVQPDKAGRYTVQLGAVNKDGLPSDVFMTGEARWLAVQIGNEAEQARVALVAVPYAMKAADAQTLGGLPASAFMMATSSGSSVPVPSAASDSGSSSPAPAAPSLTVTTTGGTTNIIPLFTTPTNIQNSILTQTGTRAVNVDGALNLPAMGTATSSKGFNSQSGDFVASVFNSGTSTAVRQTFQWQAEPLNNNTTTASGTLNLLFGQGTSVPTETGFKISSKGVLSFATGQTFPGTGTITGVKTSAGSGLTGGGTSGTLSLGLQSCIANQVLEFVSGAWTCTNAASGTVTRVDSGAGLTGGPITGSGKLSIVNGGVNNAMLANPALMVNAGTDLLGGGLVSLGGSTTLNLDTTKVPQLATANTFSGTQTINGSLGINANAPTQSLQVDKGNAIVRGPNNFQNGGDSATLYLGDVNNFIRATFNSGVSVGVFQNPRALSIVNGGNVGVGDIAPLGRLSVMGSEVTANGFGAAIKLSNAAAPGANWYLRAGATGTNTPAGGLSIANDALYAMSIQRNGQVGIGTVAPHSILEAVVNTPNGLGPALTLTNTGSGAGATSSVDFNSFPPQPGTYNPTARIAAVDDGNFSNNIVFSTNQPGAANNGLQERMRITSAGGISINGDAPMMSNPRMSFSGMFFGSLCAGFVECGNGSGSGWGAFVPDKNIVITRITATINSLIDPSCAPGLVGVFGSSGNSLATAPLPGNTGFVDSSLLPPVNIAAGTQLFVSASLNNPGSCSVGASAGGNLFINVQYVMQ